MGKAFSRRDVVRFGLMGAGGGALAACGATPTPQVVEKVVTSIVEREVTKMVEGTPQVVKETVVVEQTVEKVVEIVVTPTAASVAGPVTIRFTHVADPGELEIMQASIADFEAANPDVKVVAELVPEDGMDEKITTMVAGGAAPDAVYVHPSFVPLWAEQGVLLPQNDFADNDPDFGASDFFPETLGYFVSGGKVYGYPYYSGPSVTYFNQDAFEAAGVPLPSDTAAGFAEDSDKWTWEALLEAALPLTTGEGATKTFGYWGTSPSLHWINIAIWGYGGDVWDKEMATCMLTESGSVDAIQFQVDLYVKNNVAPQPAQAEGMPDGFSGGKVGMLYGIRGHVPGLKNVEFRIGTAPIPRGPKGRFCRNGPNAVGIIKQTRFAEAAWKLCKYMAGPKPGELGGQKFQFELQRAVPSRASLFDSPDFVDNLLPWESADVYRNAAEHVRAFPLPARYGEIQRAWREQWDLMLLGQTTVKDGVAAACTAIDEFLAPV